MNGGSSQFRNILNWFKPQQELSETERPTLVNVGRHAGSSRVVYKGLFIPFHLITKGKNFFISIVQLNLTWIVLLVGTVYLFVFFFWSLIWWFVVHFYPGCVYGASTYVETLAFSVVTQMTIGYGNTGPQACWAASWIIIVQSISAVILEAITLGIVFARISHPHQRSRSIYISNKAVISRRDGILKFMFRVADIRTTQVVEPKVKAYLYTWGEGRITAEGEKIPVRVEPLEVDYIDGLLLLPLIIEHTIDERSPLCGHTHSSLERLNAEIVVTFEGTTEMGNPFMARRSFTPDNIFWGHKFSNVLDVPTSGTTFYEVNLDLFHEVELQKGMPNLHPVELSNLVVNRAKRTVPYPLLGENTLVLSDVLCVAPNEEGNLCLYCRVADTYPNQMLEITAKMFLYRWKDTTQLRGGKLPSPNGDAFQFHPLECGYEDGTDRLHLRLPMLLTHVIDADSPLVAWLQPGGLEQDLQSEIVVVINAYMNVNNSNVLRQRTYIVDHHLRWGFGFSPAVEHPAFSKDKKPRVRWDKFHSIIPADGMEDFPPSPLAKHNKSSATQVLPLVPESHANIRSLTSIQGYENRSEGNADLNEFTVLPMMDLQRYAAAIGATSSLTHMRPSDPAPAVQDVLRYAMDTVEASDSLPHSRTLHPALPDVTDIATSDPIESRTDTQTTLQRETVTHDTNILHAETADTMASGSADAAIDENAGPVNLTTSRSHPGAMSLRELSSLFRQVDDAEDDEIETGKGGGIGEIRTK